MDERDQQPDEDDKVETVPLDMGDDSGEGGPGGETVIRQENVGRDNMEGGGEWPDPDTPPRGPSPG